MSAVSLSSVIGTERAVELAASLASGSRREITVSRRQLQRAIESGAVMSHVAEAYSLVPGTAATDRLRDKIRAEFERAGLEPEAEELLFVNADWDITSVAYIMGVRHALSVKPPDDTAMDGGGTDAAKVAMCMDAIVRTSGDILKAAKLESNTSSNRHCTGPGCAGTLQIEFVQTRSADEPATVFEKCYTCGAKRRLADY